VYITRRATSTARGSPTAEPLRNRVRALPGGYPQRGGPRLRTCRSGLRVVACWRRAGGSGRREARAPSERAPGLVLGAGSLARRALGPRRDPRGTVRGRGLRDPGRRGARQAAEARPPSTAPRPPRRSCWRGRARSAAAPSSSRAPRSREGAIVGDQPSSASAPGSAPGPSIGRGSAVDNDVTIGARVRVQTGRATSRPTRASRTTCSSARA
jgi:hypothetical protein